MGTHTKIIIIWKRFPASLHPEESSWTQTRHSLWLTQSTPAFLQGDHWVQGSSHFALAPLPQMPGLGATACWHSGWCCWLSQRRRREGVWKQVQPASTQHPGHSTWHYPPWLMGGHLREVRPPTFPLVTVVFEHAVSPWESNSSTV